MQAIRVHEFGGPEVLRLEELPIPQAGPGQVVVKNYAVGVNPADTYVRAGTAGRRPQLPVTPGLDAAGEVYQVGDGVTRLRVGDRVYITGNLSGAYAQYSLCNLSQVWPLPDNVSYEEGACIFTPIYTAYHAIHHIGRVKPGETMLVHGASGGVGLATVALASAIGVKVIGTASSPEGAKLVEERGAALVVNHREEGYVEKIMAFTEGKGVNVVIEMLANQNLAKDLQMIAMRGRICVVGSRGPTEIDPRETMKKRCSVHGVFLFNVTPEEINEMHAAVGAALAKGWLRSSIGKKYTLDNVAEAHKEIINPASGAIGKIILLPW